MRGGQIQSVNGRRVRLSPVTVFTMPAGVANHYWSVEGKVLKKSDGSAVAGVTVAVGGVVENQITKARTFPGGSATSGADGTFQARLAGGAWFTAERLLNASARVAGDFEGGVGIVDGGLESGGVLVVKRVVLTGQ